VKSLAVINTSFIAQHPFVYGKQVHLFPKLKYDQFKLGFTKLQACMKPQPGKEVSMRTMLSKFILEQYNENMTGRSDFDLKVINAVRERPMLWKGRCDDCKFQMQSIHLYALSVGGGVSVHKITYY
jgi:hypothetical protein